MAGNAFYPKALAAFARGEINWEGDALRVLLLGDGYDYSEAHDFVDDLTDVLAQADLTGATVADGGILDIDDPTVTDLDIGETATQIVIATNTGVTATSRLIMFMDTTPDGLPISRTGTGTPFVLPVSNAANRLARL